MISGWPKSARITKIVFLTLVCCLLSAWLVFYEAGSLRAWYSARQLSQRNPNISLLPIPLPDTRLANLDGERIDRLGISLQSPWKVIKRERTSVAIGYTDMIFTDGQLVIFVPPPIPQKLKKRRVPDIVRRIMTRLFSGEGFKSDYDRRAAEMDATPAQSKWWGTRNSNVRNTFLLRVKSSQLGYLPTAVYSLHFGALRGFQVGDPAVRPFLVRLALFDQSGRQYNFGFISRDREHPVLSQAQINAFVNSIRPLPLTTGSPSSN